MTSVKSSRAMFEVSWQQIDRELREIAKLRGRIDAREAVLLCSASRHQIWRNVGKASFLEYLEEVLGYTPKSARERVRVALALEALPGLADALATGEQSYSATRELTRVATAETEAAWRDAARGKNVRQIEELVAVHAPGDRPGDPPRPDMKPRVVRFEISSATFARLRQVQQLLADEHGGQLDDDALVETLCAAVLDGGSGEADQGRARFQILTTVCEVCSQGWQLGAGREIAITPTDVAIAECDAQRAGSDREPGRAKQDITPKVRRYVWRRDKGKCQVPECRASRHRNVHHIVPRHLGGGHEAENLTVLCAGHHRSLHDGALTITGRAPDITVRWNTTTPHVGRADVSAPFTSLVEPTVSSHVGHATPRHAAPCKPSSRDTVAPQPAAALGTDHGAAPSMIAAPAIVTSSVPIAATSHVGRPSKYERVVMKTEAIQGLTQLGFHKATARGLVEAVLETSPPELTLEQLLREALQRSRSM